MKKKKGKNHRTVVGHSLAKLLLNDLLRVYNRLFFFLLGATYLLRISFNMYHKLCVEVGIYTIDVRHVVKCKSDRCCFNAFDLYHFICTL